MSAEIDRPEIRASIIPDAPDDRDLPYEPSGETTSRPAHIGPQGYQRFVRETWHQRGEECTGFALAAIANHSLRRRFDDPTVPSVSRRMLYESAQLHDDEDFDEGSTLRGALKGWQRTGVTRDELWPYAPDDEFGERHGVLDLSRLLDARHRPLLRYRRILHADIDRMRDALGAGHPLFAGAQIHVGWYRLFLSEVASVIERRAGDDAKGGHAFVIVGYDERGFWVHNSWGPEWGTEGYALLPYDDWIANGNDTWVVDVDAGDPAIVRATSADTASPTPAEIATYRDMWPHLVVLGDDGKLAAHGLFEMDEGSIKTLMFLFQERTAEWPLRRLAIVSDAGYLPTAQTIERHRATRDRFLADGVYPIFVVWETSWAADLADELDVWVRRLQPPAHTARPPFERSDPLVESAVDRSVVRPIWNEVLRRSRAACDTGGGGQLLAAAAMKKREKHWFDLHLVAHGTGDLLMCGLLNLLPHPIATASLIAPATEESVAQGTYGALLEEGCLHHVRVVSSNDRSEHADVVGPVRGSMLAVISDLLDPASDGNPFGAAAADDRAWDQQRAQGRYVRSTRGELGHIGLGWSPAVIDEALSTMLRYRSVVRSATAPQFIQERRVDPLAAAEAGRSVSRRAPR